MKWMFRLEGFRTRCGVVCSSWYRGVVVSHWITCFKAERAPGPVRLQGACESNLSEMC
jgi:hypothetical protein